MPDSTQVTDTYAAQLGVDLTRMQRRDSGLYIEVLEAGDGATVESGDAVLAHYTGWLPDGRQFDSSVGKQPLRVVVGTGNVIAGWEEGLLGMQVGERRRLVIPPALGYGARGFPGAIPPNATLVFELELVEIAG